MRSNSYAGGRVEHITIGKDHTKDVQAYIDYCNIVGDDDGGKMMSEAEFEVYKKKVSNVRSNHLYVYWANSKGAECKAIGPSSMCFCKHRYKEHNTDNIKTKKVNCRKCKCSLFNYVPVHGSNDLKCFCKHSYENHNANSKKCLNCPCSQFTSNYSCDCRMPYDAHYTLIEAKEERLRNGKNVDEGGNMVAGMGGLTSFAGLVSNAYQDLYKDLLDSDQCKMLPQDSNHINNNQIVVSSGGGFGMNSKKGTMPAFDLFTTPNKFSGMGKKSIGTGVGGYKGIRKQIVGAVPIKKK